MFCLASHREGWPNVVHESLACGTPVVATDVGAVRDLIPSGGARLRWCRLTTRQALVAALGWRPVVPVGPRGHRGPRGRA